MHKLAIILAGSTLQKMLGDYLKSTQEYEILSTNCSNDPDDQIVCYSTLLANNKANLANMTLFIMNKDGQLTDEQMEIKNIYKEQGVEITLLAQESGEPWTLLKSFMKFANNIFDNGLVNYGFEEAEISDDDPRDLLMQDITEQWYS
jgi:hypothetical protein